MLPTSRGYLHVGNHEPPVAEIKLTKELKKLNRKIIECKFDMATQSWILMRERTDKSFPNAYATAEAVMQSIKHPVTEPILLQYIEHKRFGVNSANNDFRPPQPKKTRTD